ncbi:MAG: hypothetical protein U9O85_05980 [Euryarchaeota archaeon]|nr:hypothetical protein [Euryarchaeota archaeon]
MFGEDIYFHRYEIEGDLLRRYIEENDFGINAKKIQDERSKACKGLLGEFLAGFYLIKEENIANLTKLDFHRDLKSTDIDVIGETEDSVIIFQVKTNLSFNSEEHEKILENFSKVLESIETKDKKIKRVHYLILKLKILFAHEVFRGQKQQYFSRNSEEKNMQKGDMQPCKKRVMHPRDKEDFIYP